MTQLSVHGDSPKMVSKSSSLKALLMRGWRERWPATTWGIRIKTVLPRGVSGDAYNLAELLLSTSLVSPVPNSLILSYLEHALGSQLVSHLSVLQAILNSPMDPERKHRCHGAILNLLEELLKVVYQEDMDRLTELVISIFHVDLEEVTLALLVHVVPSYLMSMEKNLRLTDPHGTLLAKVTVTCIFAILMGNDKKSAVKRSMTPQGVKNFYSQGDEYYPSSKQRKMETADEGSEHEESVLGIAVNEFFKVIQSSVMDSCTVSPQMHFAVRFLEQAALRGRTRAARLIFSRLSNNMIMHLIKVVPDLFTYSLITKLFDLSSSLGRKNAARTLCFLKNVKARNEIC
uniref:Mediator of RNA polymerase II transcription subunit 24 n=1 Tax=Caligus clemensi TaxID=344056 RepID=C1C1C7_CALCM|nr:Mediator of RNA polymerase II transcription subunit 24 [Caligus clemensi]